MVKTTRLLPLAILVLACLAGCNLLVGIYPDRLMSYEAYADLSAYIDSAHLGDYNFQIIRNSSSGAEYLVLATDDGTFGDDCVVVFDADLRVLGHFTMAQLDRMDSANQFKARGAMVDASGRIVVGNRRFTVGGRSIVYEDTPTTLSGYGLAVPASTNPNLADISVSGTDLVYTQFSGSWGSPALHTMAIDTTSTWARLRGIWFTGSQLVLVVEHNNADSAHVLLVDSPVEFADGGCCEPLRDYFESGIVPNSLSILWQTLGYTNEGFAAFDGSTNQYVRFDAFGLPLGTPLDPPEGDRPYSERQLYGRSAGWYVLDQDTMTLERRRWWWK